MRRGVPVRHRNVRKVPVIGAITVGIVNLHLIDIPLSVDVPRAEVPHANVAHSRSGIRHRRRATMRITPVRMRAFLTFWTGNNTLSAHRITVRTLIINTDHARTYRDYRHILDIPDKTGNNAPHR